MKTPLSAGFSLEQSLAETLQATAELRADRDGFARLAQRLHAMTGIHLTPSEKNLSLMASRLGPVLRRHGTPGYAAFEAKLAAGDDRAAAAFVEALTTNTTDFFREPRHFECLRDSAQELLSHATRAGSHELRVWSAACSTGQEPYSIAMTLREAQPGLRSCTLRMLATDIDREVLQRAGRGLYTEAEMRAVPPILRQRYFSTDRASGATLWEVKRELRDGIVFAPFNLTMAAYPFRHKFDVIFCRNVLIYFDKPDVATVLAKLTACLRPGGFLFLGHSEAGTLRSDAMQPVTTAVFRKRAGP